MASRDLTNNFIELRKNAALKKRRQRPDNRLTSGGANVNSTDYQKLTSDDLLLEEGGIQLSSISNTSIKSNNGLNGSHIGDTHSTNNGGLQQNRPAWCDDVDTIHTVINNITRQMDALQSLHSTRVGSVFGKDLDDMEGRIESMTNEITNQFRSAEKLLQRIGAATKISGDGQQATVGANVQRSLAKKLQELSVTFRQSQRKYLTEVQNQKHGGGGTDVDSRFGIDLGTSNSGNETGDFFSTQQLAVVDDLTQAVQTRDEEIIQIARSIEELGAIFKELAVLVIDQGTVLDRIDYNMEAVVESTKTGIQQLERAEKAQKSARPLKCIMCLSSLVFVLMVILILKHHRFHIFF